MTIMPPDRNRQVVPRWRRTTSHAVSTEMTPTLREVPSIPGRESATLEEQERTFSRDPNFWTAADLLASAKMLGSHSELVDEAEELLRTAPNRTAAVSRLLGNETDTGEVEAELAASSDVASLAETAQRDVSNARDRLNHRPNSVLAWLDLALGHLTLGNRESGQRAVRAALALAPNNRLVLRSASRFFVHIEEHGEALTWLERSPRLHTDPWLMSAHIAVSQHSDAPVRHVREARSLLASDSVDPLSASELYAALSSIEFRAGRDKPARLYMRSALERPTENSVAQGVWAVDRGLRGVDVSPSNAPHAYEASTLAAMHVGNWDEALIAVQSWLGDEPFSVRAAVHGSFIAITGPEDYAQALQYADAGLRTSPGDPILLNNGAFALASMGRVSDASRYLRHAIAHDDTLRGLLTATRGYVAFRSGQDERGRGLYHDALRIFRSNQDHGHAAMCQVMWAHEEIRLGRPAGPALFEEAAKLDAGAQSEATRTWLSRVQRAIRGRRE